MQIGDFWQSYLRSLPETHGNDGRTSPAAWAFGNSEQMADELGALVIQGTKTATCSLLWEYESGGDPMPETGELSIITDGKNNPLCLIETTEVTIRPFATVDAAFAYDEGEGDRTLAFWREVHWRYFGRICETIARTPDQTMPLVCERFRVIYRTSEGSEP